MHIEVIDETIYIEASLKATPKTMHRRKIRKRKVVKAIKIKICYN
jgi:hypothetical protein